MKNYIQDGHVLDLDPGTAVPAGTGFLFGAALFGVAAVDAAAGTKSAFRMGGVFDLPKTAALAVAVGDRLYWDPVNKVVNKTAAGQEQVGVCVVAAQGADATVRMKIQAALANAA